MPADRPRIVVARPLRRIRRKPPEIEASPKPAEAVLYPRREPAPDAAKAADAADRLWRELVRRLTKEVC